MERMRKKLFEYSHKKGNVTHYKPIVEVKIEAISEDGEIALKPITDFSVHENLRMYKISNPKFKTFWVSEDHSLLVYNTIDKKVIKKSPIELLIEVSKNFYFIQKIDTSKDTKSLHDDNVRLIPIKDIKIEFDPDETTAYDFTVEDFYTFRTFDGVYIQDSMAAYFPMTEEAEQELKDRVFIENNLFTDYDKQQLTMRPGHDVVYGIYLLSKKKPESLPKPLYEFMVKNNLKELNKKNLQKFLVEHLREDKKNASIIDTISNLGFMISTLYSEVDLSIDGVINSIIPLEKREKLFQDYTDKKINMYQYMEEEEKLLDDLKKVCIFSDLIESGSRGNWTQAKQMFLQRGFVSNSVGEVMPTPVMRNLAEGLDSKELFLSCYGVRKGLSDIADNTAVSGTFNRGLIYLGLEAKMGDSKKPCNTKRFLNIKVTSEKMAKMLIGRYIQEGESITRITDLNYKTFIHQNINIRSALFCTNKNYCHYCVPYKELKDIVKGETYNVGVEAAGALGEPTTQMVLRVFHTSGATSKQTENEEDDDIVQDLRSTIRLFSKPDFDIDNLSDYIIKIYKIYSEHKEIPLLYFEVLISCLMWCKTDDEIGEIDGLWRLNQDKELIPVGYNKVPGLNGFLLGCAFKNFKRMLLTSLNKDVGDSIFEKLILD
jgi:hypothetical protein